MKGKQRIQTALERKAPDMVPIWELAFNEPSIIGIAGNFMDPAELPEPKLAMDMTDEEKVKILGALVTMAKELDLDGLTAMPLPPRERIDRDHMKDAFGVTSHLSELGEPMPVDGPIKDASDLKGYKMREPADSDFLMLDLLRGALPDCSIAYDSQAAFRLSWGLRGGMEKLLMDYILNPELAHDLAKLVTDYVIKAVDRAIDKGADWILVDGDLAFNAGPLMSPAHYDEFIGPYHKQLCDRIHQRGKKAVKHSDGNLTPLLPSLIEAGFDGVHPIQPQNMDIEKTKEDFGDRLCLVGNIDCSHLLVFEGPDEVDAAVRDTIRIAAPGGGYIISSSNTIHPGVKPENYIAMARAARKYGDYKALG